MANLLPMNQLNEMMSEALGWNDHSMERGRPYSGQPHTCMGSRGAFEAHGLTMRDLRDCYIRGYVLSHQVDKSGTIEKIEPNFTLAEEAQKGEAACICENDLFKLVGDVDPIAVIQNMLCEVERMMGIFPNVPQLIKKGNQNEPS